MSVIRSDRITSFDLLKKVVIAYIFSTLLYIIYLLSTNIL